MGLIYLRKVVRGHKCYFCPKSLKKGDKGIEIYYSGYWRTAHVPCVFELLREAIKEVELYLISRR